MQVYTTKEALDEHIQSSHKSPLLICPMCQKTLPSPESLKKHALSCQAKASGSSSSGKPIKTKPTPVLEDHPYQCFTCHKSYKSQSGLVFHNKTNHHDTEHKCNLCGKSFSRPSNVQRHIETIHTKTKSFPCKWCGKDFR